MSRTQGHHYFDDFHQKVPEFFIFHDFCVVTTLSVGERLEVAPFTVSAGWNSNICDVGNPGPPLFRWFLLRNSHILQFLTIMVLFHLGTHRKWNLHHSWLTDAHFSPIFNPSFFRNVFPPLWLHCGGLGKRLGAWGDFLMESEYLRSLSTGGTNFSKNCP